MEEEMRELRARVHVLELAVKTMLITRPDAATGAVLDALRQHGRSVRGAEPDDFAVDVQRAISRLLPPALD